MAAATWIRPGRPRLRRNQRRRRRREACGRAGPAGQGPAPDLAGEFDVGSDRILKVGAGRQRRAAAAALARGGVAAAGRAPVRVTTACRGERERETTTRSTAMTAAREQQRPEREPAAWGRRQPEGDAPCARKWSRRGGGGRGRTPARAATACLADGGARGRARLGRRRHGLGR
jgi:hypothetical protein